MLPCLNEYVVSTNKMDEMEKFEEINRTHKMCTPKSLLSEQALIKQKNELACLIET